MRLKHFNSRRISVKIISRKCHLVNNNNSKEMKTASKKVQKLSFARNSQQARNLQRKQLQNDQIFLWNVFAVAKNHKFSSKKFESVSSASIWSRSNAFDKVFVSEFNWICKRQINFVCSWNIFCIRNNEGPTAKCIAIYYLMHFKITIYASSAHSPKVGISNRATISNHSQSVWSFKQTEICTATIELPSKEKSFFRFFSLILFSRQKRQRNIASDANSTSHRIR